MPQLVWGIFIGLRVATGRCTGILVYLLNKIFYHKKYTIEYFDKHGFSLLGVTLNIVNN